MSWWNRRTSFDPVERATRIVNAVFAEPVDVRTLKSLVSIDVVNSRFIGQLAGRDGFLQLANALKPPDLVRTMKQEIDISPIGGSAQSVTLQIKVRREVGWRVGGSTEPYNKNYLWTFHFSKSGLLEQMDIADRHGSEPEDRYRYPDRLTEEDAHYSLWGRFCNFAADALHVVYQLRAVLIVIAIFAVLMLVPAQTAEALRVFYQDTTQGQKIWFGAGIAGTAVIFSMVAVFYGFAALITRRSNEPDPQIGALRWALRIFALVGLCALFWFALYKAFLQARLNLGAQSLGLDREFHTLSTVMLLAGIIVIAVLYKFGERIAFQGMHLRGVGPHGLAVRLMMLLTVFAAAIFFAFWNSPVPTVVIVWATLLLMVLGWLALLSTRTRIPFVFALFAVLAAFSFFNLNDHSIVRYDEARPKIVDARQAFEAWVRKQKPDARGVVPLFIVAAEGGGMRANVMTAMVLDELRARNPAFGDHLFAVIGVSGGSLGAASYAAAVQQNEAAELAANTLSPPDPENPVRNWQAALHADLLAPTARSLLGLDLLAHFVPSRLFDLSVWDRSRALEDAWAAGWKAATGNDALANLKFRDLGPRPGKPAPYLILMTTSIADGEPMAVSHLCGFGVRTLAGIAPAIDVPLTTAAVMSARFPIVSSPARLPGTEPPDGFVDGGYFENSGLTAATRLIRTLQGKSTASTAVEGAACPPRAAKAKKAGDTATALPPVAITVIRIENGDVEETKRGAAHFFGAMSPVLALYRTRGARAREAEQTLGDLMRATNGACAKDAPCTAISEVRFRLTAGKVPVPLGWLLSTSARQNIAAQLHGPCNLHAFDTVAAALHGAGPLAAREGCAI